MLIPRYCFSGDFAELYGFFLSRPHIKKRFRKNEYLWAAGEPLTHVYYIESGIAQTLAEHEDGNQKILSFHSAGTVFPGCHRTEFKIELSIVSKALSDMEVLSFRKEEFYTMFRSNERLNALMFEWYAMYINLLLYESAHQEYNHSFIKLCNLLYLFSQTPSEGTPGRIDLTQENIADILTVNRVNAARCLSRLREEGIIKSHRKWVEVINPQALAAYCSRETLKPENTL